MLVLFWGVDWTTSRRSLLFLGFSCDGNERELLKPHTSQVLDGCFHTHNCARGTIFNPEGLRHVIVSCVVALVLASCDMPTT